MNQERNSSTHWCSIIWLGLPMAKSMTIQPVMSVVMECASSLLDRDPMTHSWASTRWTRTSSVIHSHQKVFSNENYIGRKHGLWPMSKCYHIIIHVGTGIPELTIDQQTNQKVPRYHRHVTDIIQERKNDKWIIKVTKWIKLGQGGNSQDPMLSQMTEHKYVHTIA